MSPAPFKNPAALENVGAAQTADAANAPSTPLRVNISRLVVVIYLVVPRAVQLGAVKVACSPVAMCMPRFDSFTKRLFLNFWISRFFEQIFASV